MKEPLLFALPQEIRDQLIGEQPNPDIVRKYDTREINPLNVFHKIPWLAATGRVLSLAGVAAGILAGLSYINNHSAIAQSDGDSMDGARLTPDGGKIFDEASIVGGREVTPDEYYSNLIHATGVSALSLFSRDPHGNPEYFPAGQLGPLSTRFHINPEGKMQVDIAFVTAGHVNAAFQEDPLFGDICWRGRDTNDCVSMDDSKIFRLNKTVDHPDFNHQTLDSDLGVASASLLFEALDPNLQQYITNRLQLEGKILPNGDEVVIMDWGLLPGDSVTLASGQVISYSVEGIQPGNDILVAGWGRHHEDEHTQMGNMQVVTVTVGTEEEGYASDPKYNPETMFPAAREGKDSCSGDSGAVALVSNAEGNAGEIPKFAGVVSHGEGCARPGFQGIYTRLTGKLGDWIKGKREEFRNNGFFVEGRVYLPVIQRWEP